MKKIVIILVLFISNSFCYSIAYSDSFICDLNAGKLNNLQIGSFKEKKDIVEALGREPDDISLGYYTYLAQGFDISTSSKDGKTNIYAIVIYCQEYLDEFNKLHKSFKGRITPFLNDKETKNTISEKFGNPDEIRKDFWGMVRLDYIREYGELSFCFKEGYLHSIEMYQGNIHTTF